MDARPLAADSTVPDEARPHRFVLGGLALGALGVVYGDIGTSPLYAVKECFAAHHGLPPTPANVILSRTRFGEIRGSPRASPASATTPRAENFP